MAGNKKPKKKHVPLMQRNSELVALVSRSQGNTKQVSEKDIIIERYRKKCLDAIDAIRKGNATKEQLDGLQNFMQTALAIVDMVPFETFREAQVVAEAQFLLFNRPNEQVVMDPNKIAKAVNGDDVLRGSDND